MLSQSEGESGALNLNRFRLLYIRVVLAADTALFAIRFTSNCYLFLFIYLFLIEEAGELI